MPTADHSQAPAPTECGHETILVVEDENGVREMIVQALRRCGYTVLEAPDGPTALAQYAKSDERVDPTVPDGTAPGQNSLYVGVYG